MLPCASPKPVRGVALILVGAMMVTIPPVVHSWRLFSGLVANEGARSIGVRWTPPTRHLTSCLHATSVATTTSTKQVDTILGAAQDAARMAGKTMLETAGKIDIKATKANTRDLVTASDLECQQIIQELIESKFPASSFLGEEQVGAGTQASVAALQASLKHQKEDGLLWIVDPIDGTTNFQAGLPIYCASIGVMDEDGLLAGVIYNPVLEEMTWATRGGGAFVNGNRLEPPSSSLPNDGTSSSTPLLKDASINIGFPVVQESTLLASARAVTAFATHVRGLRMMACASQVMAWVAQGKLSSYLSWDLNAWDVAAGMLVVQEAGGCVWDFRDNAPATIETRDMIVTSPLGGEALKTEIYKVLDKNDCVQY